MALVPAHMRAVWSHTARKLSAFQADCIHMHMHTIRMVWSPNPQRSAHVNVCTSLSGSIFATFTTAIHMLHAKGCEEGHAMVCVAWCVQPWCVEELLCALHLCGLCLCVCHW